LSEPTSILNQESTVNDELPQQSPPPSKRRFGGERKVLVTASIVVGVILAVFSFFYIKFARMADARLRGGVFAATLNIYAAPRNIAVGDRLSQSDLVGLLREDGYRTRSGGAGGSFDPQPNAVRLFPQRGTDSGPVVIYFSGSQITRIVSSDSRSLQAYQFAPRLITNLSDRNREKRRLVQFPQIPKSLVDAVVSTEDKHFFSHNGFDLLRIFKAAYVDLKQGRKEEGASTLSMQLARGIWLEPDKKWKRKFAEFMLTLHLERALTKQQIFAAYANQVYLGRRGTFSINGFGEAAHAYFDKDISQLTLPESALLAGLVQRPSYYNPFRYPDRALARRNLVLRMMLANGRLNSDQYASAASAPVKVSAGSMDGMNSQYFLDLANDEVQSRLGENAPRNESIYTTLDEDLQAAAVDAVRIGMQNVDAQIRRGKHRESVPPGEPQVALIAIDPHTGEIKALVGGRDYGASQLDHVTSERQPGSVFKPFVYAAALNTALEGGPQVLTPASTVVDEPTTFQFDNRPYSPGNFEQNFMGTVSLRQALAHSLNVATVKVAQEVGYSAVVEMARRAGLNNGIKPTPAVALGSYVCTPLEIAGAYTVFANDGTYVQPTMLAAVRSREGNVEYQHTPETHPALDPRVNYLMVSMLEEVLRSGTGAGVHGRGFNLPAAGKTGTSHDGWFAGFTSRLLCIVWVGFDDYRPLGLEGAKSALPIWTEFMKRALRFSAYRDAKEFPIPPGVVSVRLCPESRQLATPNCPLTYTEYFIDGSQPAVECQLHSMPPVENPDVDGQPEPTPPTSSTPQTN
jgi:penicillin-binding protein 1B